MIISGRQNRSSGTKEEQCTLGPARRCDLLGGYLFIPGYSETVLVVVVIYKALLAASACSQEIVDILKEAYIECYGSSNESRKYCLGGAMKTP